jgi:hypothetical protein
VGQAAVGLLILDQQQETPQVVVSKDKTEVQVVGLVFGMVLDQEVVLVHQAKVIHLVLLEVQHQTMVVL